MPLEIEGLLLKQLAKLSLANGGMGELRRRVKTESDTQGIEVPWPHTKVYFGDDLKLADVERFTQHR